MIYYSLWKKTGFTLKMYLYYINKIVLNLESERARVITAHCMLNIAAQISTYLEKFLSPYNDLNFVLQ